MKQEKNIQPVFLLILDGFGIAKDSPTNAISQAKAPTIHRLLKKSAFLETSGESVGLPPNVMGNSEVGHMSIGSGRIVFQDLSRINQAIEKGEFEKNPNIQKAIQYAKKHRKRMHCIGLLSGAGVHSHKKHLHAFLRLCKKEGLEELSIHAFLDGRDSAPRACLPHLEELEGLCRELNLGDIATLSGRFYAMDRDKRWERTKKAYEALWAKAPVHNNYKDAVKQSYQEGKGDEFLSPVLIQKEACLSEGDPVFCFNYRADRMRQIVSALSLESFPYFERKRKPLPIYTMTEYHEAFPFPLAFPPKKIHHVLGEIISEAGLFQLRAAETEKYAHVTFFFNCGEEKAKAGEEWLLVDSPRDVETYDKKPEMSAPQLTEKLLKAIVQKKYSFIVANYANADMVGHTGVLPSAIQAIQVLEESISKLIKAASANNYHIFITADHGNIEEMQDKDGKPHTQHTLNPVPFISIEPSLFVQNPKKRGILADIMPSILHTMRLPIPKEVMGKNIFSRTEKGEK